MASKNKDMEAMGYVEWMPGHWAKPEDVPEAKRQFDESVAADRARREANAAAGKGPQTAADGLLDMADKAMEDGANAAREDLAARAPPDTFGVTLNELARARTQLQMAATNGRAGSVLGIGSENYTGSNLRGNQRIGIRNDFSDRYMRRDLSRNPNTNVQRTSAFNLPFLNMSRGLR